MEASRVTIMDGSMGRQLCLDGLPQDDLFRQIWSARALVDEEYHSLVVLAHKTYIQSGAQIIITNAYGVQPTFYRRAFPEEEWEARMISDAKLASKLAVQAREEAGASKEDVRIFGTLPPLNESHRPDLFATFLEQEGRPFIVDTYRKLATAQLAGGADALMLENLVSWDEADCALEAVREFDVQIILSMEGALRGLDLAPHPENAVQVAQNVLNYIKENNYHKIEALGFSCTEPETILECLKQINQNEEVKSELEKQNIALSVHANINDRKDAHNKGFDVRTDKSKEISVRGDLVYDEYSGYVDFCNEFAAMGATYIGGCCGCGPKGIEYVCKSLNNPEASSSRQTSKLIDDETMRVSQLIAPTGVLRVGLNLANNVLTTNYSNVMEASGLAPSLAKAVGRSLGVDTRFVPFEGPGQVVEAMNKWDIAFIAEDKTRSETISFTQPYAEIPASYLVHGANVAEITNVDQVDQTGIRVAVLKGTGYDNWLKTNLAEATRVEAETRQGAVDLINQGHADALAGIRAHLTADVNQIQGARVLDGQFMAARQAIGVANSKFSQEDDKEVVMKFLNRFVSESGESTSSAIFENPSSGLALPAELKKKIAVIGCGAMGSIYAARLQSAGQDVCVVDVWEQHIEQIRQSGLRVQGPGSWGDQTVIGVNAVTDISEIPDKFDLVIIATKASGVQMAAETAAKIIKPDDGLVLTIQNGLGAGERISQFIDPSKVLVGIASNFGASLVGPGHAEHKSMKKICLGELNPADLVSQRLQDIVGIWKAAGFDVEGFSNIHNQIWDKFICNCTFSATCTLLNKTVGEVLDNPSAFSLALSCAQEAFTVAQAKTDITLSFDDVETYVRNFGSTVRDAKPSMLQDHLAKRKSEIDAINGAVPVEAAKLGMTAPINQTVANAVRALEFYF